LFTEEKKSMLKAHMAIQGSDTIINYVVTDRNFGLYPSLSSVPHN